MPTLRSARCRNISAALSALLFFTTTSRAFVAFPFNATNHFGPDGPWQTISLSLRYPGGVDYSTINVYPAANMTSASAYVPTIQACTNDTTGRCAIGGTIASPANTSASTQYTFYDDQSGYRIDLSGSSAQIQVLLPQGIQYAEATVDVCSVTDVTYPNGNVVAAEVGFSSLGGNPLPANFNPPLAFYLAGFTQSNTYGLHIGSVSFNYTGSLIIGGYDRGRVIGPVLSFPASTRSLGLPLLDISIGVEDGDSPLPFDSKQNLLEVPKSAGVTQPIATYLRPEWPYIYLPEGTIATITQNLPVHFDKTAKYWLWNTSDPLFSKIVGGATYLGFTFPSLTSNAANVTIKVPFALLNLTLERSVSGLDRDVPYFPLMQVEVSQLELDYPIWLGRAFLQAAFMGTNWAQNISWIAQAPGPGANDDGLGYDPVDILGNTEDLDVPLGVNLFKQSWVGHWMVLSSNSGHNATNTTNQSNAGAPGLTAGTIAGIVIASVAAMAIVASVIFFTMRRRKLNVTADQVPPLKGNDGRLVLPDSGVYEFPGRSHVNQLDSREKRRHELEGKGFHAELPGHAPAELR